MVSLFIPTYNAAPFLDRVIDSLRSQTYDDWEAWFVDDVSTDDTVALLHQWEQRDARIHLLAKTHNEGFVPFSWLRVFPLLRGDFTLYMSQDDWLSPTCLDVLCRTQQATGADCVIPDCVFTWDDGRQRSSLTVARQLTPRGAFARMLNYDIPGFALWRTAVIRRLSMPTEAWNSDEGMQRLWALGCRGGVALCPEAKFYYRQTPASITRGLKPYHLSGLLTQRRLFWRAVAVALPLTHPKAFGRFAWQYLRSWVYLRRQLGFRHTALSPS